MASPINTRPTSDVSNQFALDTKALGNLKLSAKENSPEAIKGVAKQFEAIFVSMMLKSMREATHSEGMFDNEASKMYTSMFDQQISQKIAAGKGIGLADMLTRQLSKASGQVNPVDMNSLSSSIKPSAILGALNSSNSINQANAGTDALFTSMFEADITSGSIAGSNASNRYANAYQKMSDLNKSSNVDSPPGSKTSKMNPEPSWIDKAYRLKDELISSAEEVVTSISKSFKDSAGPFMDRFAAHANEASRSSGLPANYMLGQAALETGWGKKEIKAADGTLSFNLFGIKATPNWTGKVVNATTTEYINGVMQTSVEKFRAYDSYADSFRDFASMISTSPRFKGVMNQLEGPSSYASAIANSGYATDPQYAKKLFKVIDQITRISK
jgi:flagellar protein FlgJ